MEVWSTYFNLNVIQEDKICKLEYLNDDNTNITIKMSYHTRKAYCKYTQ